MSLGSTRRRVVVFGPILFLGSCISRTGAHNPPTEIQPKLAKSELNGFLNQIDQDIKKEEPSQNSPSFKEENLLAQPQPSNSSIEQPGDATSISISDVNERVEKWIRYFAEKDHERFQRFLDRGEKYRLMIERTLAEQGLPKELYYLAMIESGFATHARSHASAVGIWQFIRATGQRYGLRVDHQVDERIDPMRATLAAASYLKDLHTVFQSWYLAMAAYNSGEMRVLGAIMRNSNRDYWELLDKKALPRETMDYVPKVLAAAIIGNHPERFGFKVDRSTTEPQLELVRVPSRVRLADISKEIGLSYKELKLANPHLHHGITPDSKNDYKIWVPAEKIQLAEANFQKLFSKKVSRPVVLAEQPSHYQVKRGDSLHKIAQRFGVSIAHLKEINKLNNNVLHVGSRLKVYESAEPMHRTYKVRSGDSLAQIAAKHGTSIVTLKKINGLRSNTILVGTTLKVPGDMQQAAASHKVRRGENLYLIARKYSMSVDQLKRLNKLNRNHIYAGQVLKVINKI